MIPQTGSYVRRIQDFAPWLGHRGDVRDLRTIHAEGIRAVIDLALEEPPPVISRELVYCRFPLLDGADNPAWILEAAIETLADFLRASVPTLLCCGVGLSRTPTIAAAAIARVRICSMAEAMETVSADSALDVSPGLWAEVRRLPNSPK